MRLANPQNTPLNKETTIPLRTMILGLALTIINSLSACSNGSSTAAAASSSNLNQPSVAGTIAFTPAVISLNNPTGYTLSQPKQFTLQVLALDSKGQPLQPTESNPIHIDVYGLPAGTIVSSSTTSSTGSVTFTYSGESFPNNGLMNAWIKDNTNNGAAIGVTQVLMENIPSCVSGTQNYNIPLVSSLPGALSINASVGYTESSAALNAMKTYTLDTGSVGIIIPAQELPQDGSVIGPGAYGVKYYDSSGNTYAGHYYLAPVNIQQTNISIVTTQPILVLGIESAYCTGPATASCYSNPPLPTLHYFGIGFDRNATAKNDLFSSPSGNPFLHINNAQNGTNLTPGYYLTPGESGTQGLTLGITNTDDYSLINLTANKAVPGDFNSQPGCYSFPSLPLPNQFCGSALLDIGIAEMFIDLPESQWPIGSYDSNNLVPLGTPMAIAMGLTQAPAMSYNFTVTATPADNSPAPTYVQWINQPMSSEEQIFVNTGRRPLYQYDYLYNGQCGQVGFKRL